MVEEVDDARTDGRASSQPCGRRHLAVHRGRTRRLLGSASNGGEPERHQVACAAPEQKRRRERARRPAAVPAKGSEGAKVPTTLEERVAEALDAFHREVFSPRVDLTQWDINSLDGSAVRGDADDVLRGVLGR